jgi:hypothetical protein
MLLVFRPTQGLIMVLIISILWVIKASRRPAEAAPEPLVNAETTEPEKHGARFDWVKLFAFGFVVIAGLGVLSAAGLLKDNKLSYYLSGADVRVSQKVQSSEARFHDFIDQDNILSTQNIILAPIRSLYSPTPFRLIKQATAEALLETLTITTFLYLAMPYFFFAIGRSIKSIDLLIPVTVYLVIFLLAALSTLSAEQETFRYRWSGFPIFFLLAVYGWHMPPSRWRAYGLVGWWVSVLVFGAVYLQA